MTAEEMDRREARRLRRAERTEKRESFGLFGSIRRVMETALSLIQARIELIALELREEKKRALSLAFWGVALVFLGVMSMVAIMGLVVFLFWNKALAVLIGFSVFFLMLAVGSFLAARNQLQKIPFGETIAQLKKDRGLTSGEWVPLEPDEFEDENSR